MKYKSYISKTLTHYTGQKLKWFCIMQDSSKVSAKLCQYSSQVTLNYKKYSVKIGEIHKVLRSHGSSEASQLHCKVKNYYLLLKDIQKIFKLPTCDVNAHFSFA